MVQVATESVHLAKGECVVERVKRAGVRQSGDGQVRGLVVEGTPCPE